MIKLSLVNTPTHEPEIHPDGADSEDMTADRKTHFYRSFLLSCSNLTFPRACSLERTHNLLGLFIIFHADPVLQPIDKAAVNYIHLTVLITRTRRPVCSIYQWAPGTNQTRLGSGKFLQFQWCKASNKVLLLLKNTRQRGAQGRSFISWLLSHNISSSPSNLEGRCNLPQQCVCMCVVRVGDTTNNNPTETCWDMKVKVNTGEVINICKRHRPLRESGN